MAVPYSNQLPLDNAHYGIAQTHERMRDNIESVLKLVNASRRIIEETRDVMARADEVLARRLSDGREGSSS